MENQNVYKKLEEHLSRLGMGYPPSEDLVAILKETFTELEAEVALAIPDRVIPMQPVGIEKIQERITSELAREKLVETLERLYEKGLLYRGDTEDGEKGYALQQVGYGFPQTFFWKGEDTPQARKMAGMVAKYFRGEVGGKAYSHAGTKPYRYIPVQHSIDVDQQAVLPHHLMEKVIRDAERIAVGHCPCRIAYTLLGRGCDHPTEVCMKFNDLARYVIDKGIAREITKPEALEIIKKSEEAGLVHFVDNTEGDIQHNCNCCGCACWNVGNIKRRKIPRDTLMATYFLRVTDEEECIHCGECIEICPVDALKLENDAVVVDEEWCIGCGVCSTVCPVDAAKMKIRPDKTEELPAVTFGELHEIILKEKGLDKKRDRSC
jgi:Fe-S-cluster-containing hydrogenase component 2